MSHVASTERDIYMRMSTGLHTFEVRGDNYKAEPNATDLNLAGLEEREFKATQAKLKGVKNVLKPRVNSRVGVGTPLDYTYLDIKDISELKDHEPSAGVAKAQPKFDENGDEMPLPTPPPKSKSDILLKTTGLKLGYNLLSNLGSTGPLEHVDKVMENPAENLQMLDLSCNQFKTVPSGLSQFPNLSVLYLHSNQIIDLADVKKLRKLKNLQKLTLYGNAMFYEATEAHGRKAIRLEESDYYRPRIIYYLRNTSLKVLDNSPITPRDKENAVIWYKNHRE